MYYHATEFIKICSIIPVFLIVPGYAYALSGYDLKDGEHITLTADRTIINDVPVETENPGRYTGILAAGNTSINTGENKLVINANNAGIGGRNYAYDTTTNGTDFTFNGNLTAMVTGVGDIAARAIRQNATAVANFNGVIDITANAADGYAVGVDPWSASTTNFNGDVTIAVRSQNSDALGVAPAEHSNITFAGKLTDISSMVTGDGMYSYAVQNFANDYGDVRFGADQTNLTATGGQYSYGAHVYRGRIFFDGDTTINASGGSEWVRGVSLQGDIGHDPDKTYAQFSGDNITINVTGGEGLYVSGSYAESSSKNMVINSDLVGVVSQYSSELTFNNDSHTTINVKSPDGDVFGLLAAEYGDTGGTIVSRGTMDINANGKNTYGVLIQDNSTLDASHLNVIAAGTGQTMAMAVENSTNVSIGGGDQASVLRANGDDAMGLFVGEGSAVRVNGDVDISGDTYSIYNDGALKLATGDTTIHGDVAGDGALTINKGASLNVGTATVNQETLNIDGVVYATIQDEKTYGKLYAENYNIGENSRLVLNNIQPGKYAIFSKDVDIKIDSEFLYDMEMDGVNGLVIKRRTIDEIAVDTGLTRQASALSVAMADSTNPQLRYVYDTMLGEMRDDNPAVFESKIPYYNDQAERANPYGEPLIHSLASTWANQVADLAAWRMDDWRLGEYTVPVRGIWIQGMYNWSELSDKFTTKTNGMSFGIDSVIRRKYTLGIGYANNKTDVDVSGRNIDVNSNTLFGYAQYKPNKWFVNATAQYTMGDYTEDSVAFGVPISADRDINAFGTQVMTGYDFNVGLTPAVGVRYMHLNADGYSNEFLRVSDVDGDFVTAIGGVKYAQDLYVRPTFRVRPTLSANATYDIISDDMRLNVTVPGVTNYHVRASHLSRMGGEFGVGVNFWINSAILSVNYTLDLHQDYTSQTAMLRMKLHF